MRPYLVAFLIFLFGLPVFAQSGVVPVLAAPDQAVASNTAGESLVLSGRTVFLFRGPSLGVSAADRAKRAQYRIHEQLALKGPYTVSLKADPVGMLVQVDGATSFVVTATDVDPGRDDNLEQTAQAASTLALAINETLESRSLQTFIRALASALGATVLYGGLVWFAGRARRSMTNRLVSITTRHTEKLQVGGLALVHRDRLASAVRVGLVLVYRLLVAVLTVEWVSFVLRSFPFTRAWGESLNSFLLSLVVPIVNGAFKAVPDLLTALMIFFLTYLVSQALGRLFAKVQSGAVQLTWLDADVVAPTQHITKGIVWLFGLAMAYPYLPGSDTEAFKGLSVLVGLMLSLGASSLVGQAASGLILTYGRVFRKGEYVSVAEHEGTVTEMGIFTTRIRTGLGEELTVSNASILGTTTRNYSRAVKGVGFVLDTNVSIGYDTSWRQVHALLIEAAKRTTGVLHDPAPQVFQTALSDWYPVYRLVCQAVPEGPLSRALVLSSLHGHIQDVFNEYGVQIMSPQYIADPLQPKIVPPEKWHSAPASGADR